MPSSEKYPIRSLAHFFIALFYIVNYMSCLYVLQMNSWCLSSFTNIFYPFLGLSFSFFFGVLCCAHAFKVYYVPFVSFWLTFHDSKRCIFFNCCDLCQSVFCLYFPQEFYSICPYIQVFKVFRGFFGVHIVREYSNFILVFIVSGTFTLSSLMATSNCHSRHWWRRVLFSAHHLNYFLFVKFLTMAIITGVW